MEKRKSIMLLPASPLLCKQREFTRCMHGLHLAGRAGLPEAGACGGTGTAARLLPPASSSCPSLTRPACASVLTPGWSSSTRLVRRSSTEYLGSLAQIAPTTSTSTTRILTVGSRASSRPAPLQPNRGGRSLHAPARAPLSATEATPPLNLRSRLAQLHNLNLTSCCFRPLINTCSHEHAEDLECY